MALRTFIKIILLMSAFLVGVGCKNPLSDGHTVSTVDPNFQPGISRTIEPINITLSVPFTNGSENNFLFDGLDFSSSMNVEIADNKVRLKPIVHSDSSANSFAGGTHLQTVWDSNDKIIRLNSASNTSRLESTWTPRWNNLVAYWRMENNWTDSIGSYNGTAVNGPTLSSANKKIESYSGSFNPSGYDDRVVVNDPGADSQFDFNSNDEIAISAWVNYTGSTTDSSYRYIIGKGRIANSSTNQNWGFRVLAATNGFVRASFIYRNSTDTGWNVWSTNYSVPSQMWQHWIVTYKFGVASSIKVYINGEALTGSWTEGTGSQAPLVNDSPIWIGNSLGTSMSNFFQGYLDDIAIWRKYLTEDEVRAIYQRQSARVVGTFESRIMNANAALEWTSLKATTTLPFYKELPPPSQSEVTDDYSKIPALSTASPGLSGGLMGYWKMNESAGPTFTSSVGTNMNLTAYNSPIAAVMGRFGNAVRLARGGSHYLATSTAVALGSKFTYSAWLNLGLVSNEWHTLLANTSIGTTSDGFKIAVGAWGTVNNSIRIETGDGTATATAETPASTFSLMTWHHVTITVDRANGSAQIYLNGVLKNASSTNILTNFKNTGTLYFGRAQNAQGYANGVFDEIALYDRVLSVSEIVALYRRGANRIKYQIRTCSSSSCATENANASGGHNWYGPDLTIGSYFTELNNNTMANLMNGTVNPGRLSLNFADFTGLNTLINPRPWFQYRAILENSDGSASTLCTYNSTSGPCSPELSAMDIGPIHYDTNVHKVSTKSTMGAAFSKIDANGFSSTSSCTQGVRFSFSANGNSYYYWNGLDWTVSEDTYATANDESDIKLNISKLTEKLSSGNLHVATFLKSDGTSSCEVSKIEIRGLSK